MSIDIDYFFNSDAPLSSLGELIGRVLGCRFEPYQGNPLDLFCRLFSLETSLSEHDLENDKELDFASTRYVLGIRTPVGDGDLREIQIGLMATIPALLHKRAGISAGLLVYDVQRLLAKYELQNGRFFDVVSGLSVVFPEHLDRVYSLVQS